MKHVIQNKGWRTRRLTRRWEYRGFSQKAGGSRNNTAALVSSPFGGYRKMNDDSRIISSGPFKGKKIEFATTTGVDMFLTISDEFMKKIFDFTPGEYLISDESCLHDFTGLNERDLTGIQKKIRDVYDLDISDIEFGNLLEIFKRIHNKLYGAPSL